MYMDPSAAANGLSAVRSGVAGVRAGCRNWGHQLHWHITAKRSVRELEKNGFAPILHATIEAEFPRVFAHLARLRQHPAFAPKVEPYLQKFETAGDAT
jgi:hypothetical protein